MLSIDLVLGIKRKQSTIPLCRIYIVNSLPIYMKGMFNMYLKSQKTNEKQILLEIEYTNPCNNSMFDAIETKAQVEYQELS